MIKSVRRLAELFLPANYNLHLTISNRTERVFNGEVTIDGELTRTAEHIVLHAKDLRITSATIDGKIATATSGSDDELILAPGSNLAAGPHTLHIVFDGTITDPMHGLYPCYFTENGEAKELLMTQLESHYAREVFPCVDEPAAKATFALTLTTEPGITVLSNTPVASQKEEKSVLITSFEPTPRMSTYLLAFVAGDLAYAETTSKHGVQVRIYATPSHKHELGFALKNAAQFLDFLDDFFGTPYPLPKCDLVACPDFAAGAMENWGLLTFREAALLVDEKDTPADSRQYIASVIAHELAHQWFGDLVTMEWWDYLWLNESFANWMEHYAPAHFYPEWQLWEQYNALEQQSALTRDGLASVQAVQQHVNHPDEIATLFDSAIVYAKGGSLIRMLHEYLGDEVFREGLRIYMARHKYGNTTTQDLWRALGEAAGKDVESFMGDWVTKPGHPVVEATIHDSHTTLTQKRFFANPAQANKDDKTVWPIPLLCATLPDVELLTEKSIEAVIEPAEYHLFNKGGTGFYHVHYDTHTIAKLARAVSEGELDTIDRQRLLQDSVALNRAGIAPTIDTLRLLSHYSDENNYAVWLAISSALGVIRLLINNDPIYKPHLQRFVADVSRAQFDRLGWQNKPDESHFDTLLRPTILSNMAYAEDSATTKLLLDLYDKAARPEDIQSDIRSIVYSVAVRERGKPVVDRLIEWYRSTTSAEERVNLAAGITATRDPNIAKDFFALVTTKTVKLQDVVYWFIYAVRNHYISDVAWQWMTENWEWITKNFDDHDRAGFAKYAANAFSTHEEQAAYKQFFEPKLQDAALARVIKQGFEDMEIRVLWRERDFADIADFLKKSN